MEIGQNSAGLFPLVAPGNVLFIDTEESDFVPVRLSGLSLLGEITTKTGGFAITLMFDFLSEDVERVGEEGLLLRGLGSLQSGDVYYAWLEMVRTPLGERVPGKRAYPFEVSDSAERRAWIG